MEPGFDMGRTTQRGLPSLVATVLAAVLGCGDDRPAAPGVQTARPVPGCEAIDHTPCDVRGPSCRTRLFSLAACLRGEQADAAALPPTTVISEADFATMLAAEASAATPAPYLAQWDWALSALRLITPGGLSPQTATSEAAKFIWGYYRYRDKTITLVDHGAEFDERSASAVLVHEFVHALQDREVDLAQFGKTYETSRDSSLAASAVVEGEARMHETRYAASLVGLDPADVDWIRRFNNAVARDQASLLMGTSPLTASDRAFPYEWGARYDYYTWTAGGMGGIHARLVSPPVTTRVLMASTDRALDPEPAPDRLPAPAAPPGWTALDSDTLGAWALLLLLSETALGPGDEASTLALQWRGDGIWVYDGPAGVKAFAWRIELGDEATARRAAQVLSVGLTGAQQVGTRLVIARSSDGQTPTWAFDP